MVSRENSGKILGQANLEMSYFEVFVRTNSTPLLTVVNVVLF